MTQVVVCRLDGARKGFNLNELIWEILFKSMIEKMRFGSLFSTLQKLIRKILYKSVIEKVRFGSLFSTLQTTENVSCRGACRWKLLPPARYFISREKILHVRHMLPRAVERSRLS